MERVELKLLGISYKPVKQGAFAMLLAETDGPYRIPVLIGAAEAQSIAVKMEGIITPRPLTHDLFCSTARAFGLRLIEVFIYQLDEDGIFFSEMVWTDGDKEVRIESRTSDAVAMALREDAPIFTTREILHKAGSTFIEADGNTYAVSDEEAGLTDDGADLESLPDEQLQKLLDDCINSENYEEAARIAAIIKKRGNDSSTQA